jgi:hypothetical protein
MYCHQEIQQYVQQQQQHASLKTWSASSDSTVQHPQLAMSVDFLESSGILNESTERQL